VSPPGSRWPVAGVATGPRQAQPHVLPLLRDTVALSVTAFFGLQALTFSTLLAWLPSVLRDAGVAAAEAGAMLAVAASLGVPVSFLVPRLCVRRPSQGKWVLLVATPTLVGLLGLLIAPREAPRLWLVLLGAGTGAAFPLGLTLVLLRSRDSAQAVRLSAAAQGAGYVIASAGPFGIGLLHDATGSWMPSLVVLVARWEPRCSWDCRRRRPAPSSADVSCARLVLALVGGGRACAPVWPSRGRSDRGGWAVGSER